MTDCGTMMERVRDPAAQDWDVPATEDRYRKLLVEGIPDEYH